MCGLGYCPTGWGCQTEAFSLILGLAEEDPGDIGDRMVEVRCYLKKALLARVVLVGEDDVALNHLAGSGLEVSRLR